MALRFVVHEHHATRLHYDFRLEWEGVLKSWAVPKGPSMNPADKRLAISVEDHLIEYVDFEGIIPDGQYGAGAVVIWDQGFHELMEWKSDRITFNVTGDKLKGAFTLTRLKSGEKGNEWLLIKKKDEYSVIGWKLLSALTEEKKALLETRMPPCSPS
jgi:bifunctional non-homologous end joining protein LigD